MKNLMDLPNELILMVFNYLDYDDLIVLKSLNEELTDLFDYFIKSKILLINQRDLKYKSHRYDNLYLIGRSLNLLQSENDLHLSVQKLVLFYPNFISDLASFDNLIDLKIYLNRRVKTKSSDQLSLRFKNLKNLKIILNLNLRICLDTPKLTNLKVGVSNLDRFEIIYPSEIKYLKTHQFSQTINQLNNLEELNLFRLNSDRIGDLFDIFKKLKKFSFYYSSNSLNSTKQFLKSILSLNPTLKISQCSIDLNSDLNPLQSSLNLGSTYLNESNVKIYMNYLDNVSNLTHHSLTLHNFDLISTEFIQKLTKLKILSISEIKDQEKWIQLLSLPELTNIRINSFVDQKYLTLIPKYCGFLTDLTIERFENVEWLLRLKYLEYLETRYQFDFEIFKKMMNNLNYLELVKINLKDVKKIYEIEIQHGNVECFFNPKIEKILSIQKCSKSSFLKMIESFNSWNDLLLNSKVE